MAQSKDDPGTESGGAPSASGIGSVAIDGSADNATITTNVTLQAAAEKAKSILTGVLPESPVCFHGREKEESTLLTALKSAQGSQAITALRGIGGIGKTALALRVAHQLVEHYPAAQLFIELQDQSLDSSSSLTIMKTVIRHFEPDLQLPDDATVIASKYRQILRDHKSLLILDNARDGAQVKPLLPPAPSAAIVTARRIIDLPELSEQRLGSLSRDEAVAVLKDRLAKFDCKEEELNDLAVACVDHPLALTVAGSYMARHWDSLSIGDYTARITENRDRLKLEGDEDYDVMASLDLSLRMLLNEDAELAERWRDLAVFPSDFDSLAVAAIWKSSDDDELDKETARDLLLRLLDLGFVDPLQAVRGRFRLHDLMRDLAMRGQASDRFQEPQLRRARHFLMFLSFADNFFLSSDANRRMLGLRMHDVERTNILAALRWVSVAVEHSDEVAQLASQYANAGVRVLSLRMHSQERILWFQAAMMGAIKVGDRQSEGVSLGNLGAAYTSLGNIDKAIECNVAARTIFLEIGDRAGEGVSLGNLGIDYAHLGEIGKAIECYEATLAISREVGDRWGEGAQLGNLGNAFAHLGMVGKAIEYHEAAIAISHELGDRWHEGVRVGNLGLAYADSGQFDRAIECYEKALTISIEIGNRASETSLLGNLGTAYVRANEIDKAIEFHERGLRISREIGARREEGTHLGNLGVAHLKLSAFDKAIEYHQNALRISREVGDRQGEGNHLGNLGKSHILRGDVQKAIDYFEQSVVVTREIGFRQGEGNGLSNLGSTYRVLGQAEKAILYYEKALLIFEEIENPNAQVCRNQLAELHASQE